MELDQMKNPFEVRIPHMYLVEAKAKLAREQRHKAAQDQIWYSALRSTFWKWTKTPNGWCQQKCSRNGRRLGDYFGRTWNEVEFTKRSDGSASFHARTNSRGGPSSPTVDLPDFLPHEYVCKPRMISPKIRLSYPSLEKPMLSPLKLSILLWYAAHPCSTYLTPTGGVDHVSVRTANSELVSAGLIELRAIGYQLTAKGRVFVEHLAGQPLPVQTEPTWVMPASGGLVDKPGWIR
jgi:hypothetical protein